MKNNARYNQVNATRIVLMILLAEFLIMLFSGVGFSGLHGNPFFSLEADPATWLVFLTHLPQFILQHEWLGLLMDTGIAIGLLLLIRNPARHKLATVLFILLFIYYCTLTAYLTHRNFQSGLFLCLFPFLFAKERSRAMAFEACRYFLLFFYASAACWKLYYFPFGNGAGFSQVLLQQFAPYYLEANTGIRTSLNQWLAAHIAITNMLYFASFIVEFSMITGFFTKRFDRWLAVLLVIFHCTNWVIMDIGAVGQIAFISLLFFSKQFRLKEETL